MSAACRVCVPVDLELPAPEKPAPPPAAPSCCCLIQCGQDGCRPSFTRTRGSFFGLTGQFPSIPTQQKRAADDAQIVVHVSRGGRA